MELRPDGCSTFHDSLSTASGYGSAPDHPLDPARSGWGVNPLLPVLGADLAVPLVTGETLPYANLDYAASAPCLQEVANHLAEILPFYASVHRGAGYSSQVSTSVYEGARAQVAAFVGARDDDVVVFTRNTTDALNLLAGCVPTDDPSGGEVVFLDIEHHANLLPWQRGKHRCVLAGTTQRATLVALRAALAARPAALVAVTGASNVTGEVLPLEGIVAIAHEHGARVVLDAAQLAPHRRIDLASSGVDYVAFSGHKLYAPLGSGVLVGRRDWLDEAPAYLPGGGAVREVGLTRTTWASAPQRHEGGTPNVLGAAALARACQALAQLPDGALEAHENALRDHLISRLDVLAGVRLHRIWRDSPSSIGVVAFSIEGFHPGFVAAYLSAEHGIGVRDGKFCAHPLISRLGATDGALRASFGVGNTLADVDRLASAVEELLTTGPRWEYAVVDGRWAPTPDLRPIPAWAVPSENAATGTAPCEGEPTW
ncbi:aminotransferase class V-fold PLP-dependent enzyme [Actinopolymorpha alba]|uniref:aminotransferase class V-fold PLP-dependent enzyme n=1 Tax=Actinopolymorpha alba TaxID=533267 RepID=UPI00035DE333|nr:aminotransferase class V-fold PLP-dependent enzyme [Actinopolymorpha alba]